MCVVNNIIHSRVNIHLYRKKLFKILHGYFLPIVHFQYFAIVRSHFPYSVLAHLLSLPLPVQLFSTPLRLKRNTNCSSQTWGESTFNDSESESDSGRLFDSESDSSQFGYDSESNSDSSNISISDCESESDSNFQLLI